MAVLRIEGYVIISADGMLADANRVMPDSLKFEGDQAFFTAGLDAADLIVHGRHSFEDQPGSAQRNRVVLTRTVKTVGRDPDNTRTTLWNPMGATFEDACELAGVRAGVVAVIGGPIVFTMFFNRYDTFWLSQAPHVRLPGGEPCFSGVPERTPESILTDHGLRAAEVRILDAANDVRVTAWKRVVSLR